jgi:CHASE1-domain containing sensor protein
LILSALAWFATAVWEDQIAEAEFTAAAGNHLIFLQEGFLDFDDVMRSYHGFLEGAAGVVGRKRLDQYAAPMVSEYKGISDLAWVPRVSQTERSVFEAAARRDGQGEYRIFEVAAGQRVPPADQAEYYPILYPRPHGIFIFAQNSKGGHKRLLGITPRLIDIKAVSFKRL